MIDIPGVLQDRLNVCRTLPSVPAVAIRIIDLCKQEDIGIPEIAKALAQDPALAARVLKTANSAFYGVRSEVKTLDRAISILGINATLSLSLGFSLVGTMRRSDAGFDHLTYWRRSVITAAAARVLGASISPTNRDEYFLAGLLQDIGILFLNEAFHDSYGKVVAAAKGSHEKLVQLEMEAFGANHAAVGGWLLERWELPVDLTLSVAASHIPEIIDTAADLAGFCRTTAFAGHVAEIWTNPETAVATAHARQQAKNLVQLTPDRFERLLGDVAASLPEITSNLDLEIGSEDTLNRLLDQAREALVVLNLQAQEQVRLAESKARHDALTSLYNRNHLEDVLPQFFDEAVRTARPLSSIFVDIDHFKKVNDSCGHQAGDSVIAAVARILLSAIRAVDVVARYGGEEYVCLLSNTSEPGAKAVAERIRTSVASSPQKLADGREIQVTVSLGCATFSSRSPFANGLDLLRAADRCMYAAKYAGRNKVVAFGELTSNSACRAGRGQGTDDAKALTG